ncbi:hypothetical protein ACTMTJ_19545 [Phytohabitans sp. LJ34]|uniref:hypothetical protein n=1 Tax=Phytohabitans sp. LJ34 TaxID=3452217 RepID=UPI003F89D061
MTELRELFEEAVGAPPPSHLTAGDVYKTGRRRHRVRTALAAACAAAVAGVLLAGGGLLLPGRSGQDLPAGDPPTPPAVSGTPVQWAGAADATHLYLARMGCATPSTSCPKTISQLYGSGDGGRTWTRRGAPLQAPRLAVVGPQTLLASVFTGRAQTLTASTDGARTWHRLREGAAVDAVPGGSLAVCWAPSGESCTLWSVDPAGGRFAPLRVQPALVADPADLVPAGAGDRIWVRGTDPATGRPAVAVSADAGHSWSVQVFADAPACRSEGCRPPYLATDGATAYAVVAGASARAVYRHTTEDGRWTRMSAVDAVPAGRLDAGDRSFVAADGTHVLCETVTLPDGRDGCRFWAGRDGAYQTVEPTGLPATVYPFHRAADGSLYTFSYTTDRIYLSADGWTWSAR